MVILTFFILFFGIQVFGMEEEVGGNPHTFNTQNIVKLHGTNNWQTVAEELDKSCKQVRERWFNVLDPSIIRSPWTYDEIETLIKKQAELGNKWAKISKFLPGRPETEVKNEFNRLKREAAKKSNKRAHSPEYEEDNDDDGAEDSREGLGLPAESKKQKPEDQSGAPMVSAAPPPPIAVPAKHSASANHSDESYFGLDPDPFAVELTPLIPPETTS